MKQVLQQQYWCYVQMYQSIPSYEHLLFYFSSEFFTNPLDFTVYLVSEIFFFFFVLFLDVVEAGCQE